jgi:heme oxygenase (biliverdin-IX-beta and delta-forming)
MMTSQSLSRESSARGFFLFAAKHKLLLTEFQRSLWKQIDVTVYLDCSIRYVEQNWLAFGVSISTSCQTSMEESSFREVLKFQTAHQHRALETQIDVFARCASLNGYRDLLLCYWYLHRALEPHIVCVLNSLDFHTNYHYIEKTELLEKDILALDSMLLQFKSTKLSLQTSAKRIESHLSSFKPFEIEQCVGALYVLEGSQLGGQMICRRLKRDLSIEISDLSISSSNSSPTAELPLSFFYGLGDGTWVHWDLFLKTWIHNFPISQNTLLSRKKILTSAQHMFSYFSKWVEIWDQSFG